MARGEVQGKEDQIQSSIAQDVPSRVRREGAGWGCDVAVDGYRRRRGRRHGARWILGGEREEARGRIGIRQRVEFSHGRDVAGAKDGAAHHEDGFGPE